MPDKNVCGDQLKLRLEIRYNKFYLLFNDNYFMMKFDVSTWDNRLVASGNARNTMRCNAMHCNITQSNAMCF